MAQQGPNPLPPTTVLSSEPVSQAAAHDFLAAYLNRAETDPALQPNAAISEHGPVSRATAAAPNLILHNLKRVQAGLAGKVLGRDLSLISLNFGDEDGGKGTAQSLSGTLGRNGGESGDWQDARLWARERDGEGEEGDDNQDEGMHDDDSGQRQMSIEDETNATGGRDGTIDKEERKRKKKERRLAEKRAKAKKRVEAD